MDIIDQAAEREQMDRDLAIAAAHRHAPSLPYTGLCHNCGDITGGGRCFCDCDCRNDYTKRKSAEARCG